MKFKIDFGAEIDVLTRDELDQSLGKFAAQMAQRARGIKYVRRVFQPAAVSFVVKGPDLGFCWNVKLIGVQFSAADSLKVAYGEAGNYPVWGGVPETSGTTATTDVATWGSDSLILNGGESLLASSAGGVNTITQLILTAIEVPAERLGLILS